MELKSENHLDDEALSSLSLKALEQIDEKNYDVEMKAEGVVKILKLGIAFSGKNVKISQRL